MKEYATTTLVWGKEIKPPDKASGWCMVAAVNKGYIDSFPTVMIFWEREIEEPSDLPMSVMEALEIAGYSVSITEPNEARRYMALVVLAAEVRKMRKQK